MIPFFLDFETRSRLNLKQVGAYRYAEDPSTEVLRASWAGQHGGPFRWRPMDRGGGQEWLHYVDDPAVTIVAHNAEFERLILAHKFGRKLAPSRFRCTAALCARYGLPRSLDLAGQALALEHLKDAAAGKRLINKLCKPRRSGEWWEEEDAPEDFEALEEYNEGDVLAMREIWEILPPLSDREQALWELTIRMNERGLPVDTEAMKLAQEVVLEEKARLSKEWERLVGCKVGSPLGAKYLGLPSLRKVEVRHALRRTDLTERQRYALEIRKMVARTSVQKLWRLERMVSTDGRYRGALIYSGAERTQRWSGSGVQAHNLPRGLGRDTDAAFRALTLHALAQTYDDSLRTVSEMLKGFFVGPFVIGDLAQIEARVTAWYAGQTDLVDAFRAGAEIYCDMASDIYGVPVGKEDYDEELHIAKRQLGKIVILGAGYGLGGPTLVKQLDENFDVALHEDPVLARVRADDIIAIYRAKYRAIPKFWGNLEKFFRAAIRGNASRIRFPGGKLHAGVRTFHGRRFAYLELPNGRPIYYYQPVADEACGSWPDGRPKTQATYFGRNIYKGGKWERVSTYGGKLTENAVQAFSRDFLAAAVLEVDRAGGNPLLTVHDEIVAQPPLTPEDLFRIMTQVPEWAEGLPLSAETYGATRYRKN
jgi:DNA polymerase